MKNYHTLLFARRAMALLLGLLMFSSVTAQKVSYSDSWSEHGFSMTRGSATGVELMYSVKEFTLTDIDIKGEAMKHLAMPGNFLPTDEGTPNLPGMGQYIAIPQGATPTFEITASRVESFKNVNISPAPRIPKVTDEGPLVYNKNTKIYSRDAFYPSNTVTLSQTSSVRGVDVVIIGVTPYQYNPVTKELLVYRDLEVKVNFEGGNGQFGDNKHRNRWFEPILDDILINYSSLPKLDFTKNGGSANRDETIDYIIITPDDPAFIAWGDSLKLFRNRQGIATECFTIPEVGGNDATAIETFINNAYNNWNTVACLLMADWGNNGSTGNTITSPKWGEGSFNNYCVSDNIYGDINGDDLPEVVMARMTAQNETHLETMVTKVLNHERNPPTDPGYYNHPITALGWQTERWFQICSETVGGYFKHVQGKDPVRINEIYSGTPGSVWSTNENTSMVIDYFGPAGLGYIPLTPAELGGWSGGNASMINNAINAGSFMLQHRDHGYEYGWGEPDYSNGDIDGLTNTDLCFIFSINCLTGKYDISGECFTEKFHRYTYNGENSGANGLTAASEVSYSFVNDTYVWGVFDNMWPDFMPDYQEPPIPRGLLPAFGNAGGKFFLEFSNWPSIPQYKAVTQHLFHHHGDAFQTLYSEVPQNLTVIHDDVLLAGLETFSVQADDGAFIALSVDGQIIGTADATGGSVDIAITAQYPPAVVDIVVTKTNYYRYESKIGVIPPTGPYVIKEDFTFNDEAGNGDGELDYGESILLSLGMKNVGIEDGENVVVTISSEDDYVSFTTYNTDYGTVPAGEVVTVTDGFAFDVGGDVPDLHTIIFNVEATDGNDTWNSAFSAMAHAPHLQFVSTEIDDSQGNGNGRVDPGETVNVIVTVTNTGSADAYTVMGEMLNTDPYITINSDPQEFGDVANGAMAEQSFSITALPIAPPGYSATCTIEFTGFGGLEAEGQFNIIIGRMPALVIDLDKSNVPSGTQIQQAIQDLGISVEYTNVFPEELGNYSTIFVCLGVYSDNTKLLDDQGQLLADYLDNGGYLYMEGGDTWFYDPETPVHPYFNIHGISDGGNDLSTIIGKDATFTEGMTYSYAGDNNWIDYIEPEAGSDAFTVFSNAPTLFDCAVAFVGSNYKTIGSSFEFGGLSNGSYTKMDLMEKYLSFFNLEKLPEAPPAPTGPPQVCQNSNNTGFTTTSVAGATMYVWLSDPPEATELTYGEDTVAYVQWSETFNGTAQLSVCALNSSGLGPESESIDVAVNQMPTAIISGSGTICEGESIDLTVELTGAGPWTITTMGGTQQIDIPSSPYQISVSPTETMDVTINTVEDNIGCFNIGEGSAPVTVEALPIAPETPTGADAVNSDTNPTSDYTTTVTPNTTDHVWMITPSTAGTLVMNNNSCTVTWTPGFNGVAQLTVQGVNDCGEGPASTSFDISVESSFGISENSIGIGVSVFPNPSEGVCNIELNSGNKQEVNIKVMNALGFPVFTAQNLSFEGTYKGTLDLSDQAEGLYFLIIENDKGVYYKKLIVK